MREKAAQIYLLLLTALFSPFALAVFSEKWGYFSIGACLLLFLVVFGLSGLSRLREYFKPRKLTQYDFDFHRLLKEAELHHKDVATEEESLERWANGHINRRVAFLSRYIRPLVDQGLVTVAFAVKKEDLVLITRYFDLVHAATGDTFSRQRADKVEIERYFKQLPHAELKSFTLRKLIRIWLLTQKIGSPKHDQLWDKICDQYDTRSDRH